jgi:iron complex transport system ATP-binding protein
MSEVIIHTDQLSIGYGEKTVLSDISVSLDAGSLVAFMGPNGSGKSTLLKTISGFHPSLRGEVYYRDKPISSYSRSERAQAFSVVLTDRIHSEYMTGRELVTLGRLPHTNWLGRISPDDENQITHALEITECREYADAWLYELSDGQRQKLFIARALAQETPIILLDEPTAHLDLNNRVIIINLLHSLAHEHGRSILMATHELDLALQRADLLWLADPGNSVITGMPEDLVLNGEIDRVFQFKGYDLKSGQVTPPVASSYVKLEGSGAIYLWTKNALERNAIGISPDAELEVQLSTKGRWIIGPAEFNSLSALVHFIRNH